MSKYLGEGKRLASMNKKSILGRRTARTKALRQHGARYVQETARLMAATEGKKGQVL